MECLRHCCNSACPPPQLFTVKGQRERTIKKITKEEERTIKRMMKKKRTVRRTTRKGISPYYTGKAESRVVSTLAVEPRRPVRYPCGAARFTLPRDKKESGELRL